MTATARRLAIVLIVLGGIGYADWVLQLVVPVHADLTTSFISELSAGGQPHREVFRIADLVAGVVFGAGVALAWALSRRWARVWLPLLVLSACTVFEAAVTLGASYSFGTSLPPPGTGSWWAKVAEPHGISSFLETVAFLTALATATVALRQSGADTRRRRALLTIGVVAALSGVVDAVLTVVLLVHGNATGLGLTQRFGVSLTAVWLALAPTWLLLRSSEPDQGRRANRSATSTRRPV